MSRIFVTGSADGLGLMAARLLVEQGHAVTLHARNAVRAREACQSLPDAEAAVTGDLSSIAEVRRLAAAVNALGPYDAVIHNAGVGDKESSRVATADGLAHVFAVNVLAPYLLTALISPRPTRLVYITSALNRGSEGSLDDPQWVGRPWNGPQAYADSKLLVAALAFAVARRWPQVRSNAVEPGWVATKMGGPGARDDLSLGPVTQAWLAVSNEPAALVNGEYFYHQQLKAVNPLARREDLQDALIAYCSDLTGTQLSA